jgi:hypothetical protein
MLEAELDNGESIRGLLSGTVSDVEGQLVAGPISVE